MPLALVIVLPWLLLRWQLGFRPGLACDALLVAAWAVMQARVPLPPLAWHPALLPVYCAGGYIAYQLGALALSRAGAPKPPVRPVVAMSPWTVVRLSLLAPLHEETAWRLAAQGLLVSTVGTVPAIVAVAAAFTAWHRSVWRSPAQAAELFAFALLAGACMACTSDPLLPLCLHTVRNVCVLNPTVPSSWRRERN